MSRGFHEHFLGTDLFFPQGTQTPETKRPPKRPALVVPYLEKKRRRKKRTKKEILLIFLFVLYRGQKGSPFILLPFLFVFNIFWQSN